jgi:hypothetical protein
MRCFIRLPNIVRIIESRRTKWGMAFIKHEREVHKKFGSKA